MPSYYLLFLFYCFLSCESTFTNDDDHFGGIMNLLELDTVKYEVEILPIPVVEEETAKRESSLVMTSKHGQKYQCQLPSDAATDWSMEEDESDGSTPYTNIPELLEPLKSKCLVTNEGWWNYKYCHGIGVTQFHMEGGRIVGDIVYLGYYDNEITWTKDKLKKALNNRIKNRNIDRSVTKLPSHDVHYINGTKCELTGLPRSVTARLTCSSFHTSSEIVKIVEQESCNYTVLIHTPHLCDHPLFIPDNNLGMSLIQCSPMVSQQKYNRFMQSLQDKKSTVTETEPDKVSLVKPSQDIPTTGTVPLMNVLESLADSIAQELTVDTSSDNEVKDSTSGGDEKEISKELEDAIENLVTESLNKVFGISDTRNEEELLPEQSDDPGYPKGPKSKPSSQHQGLESEHEAVTPSKEQAKTKSGNKESGLANKMIIKKISLDGKQSQNKKSRERQEKKEEPDGGTTKEQHKHSIAHSATGNSETDSNDDQTSNAASVLVSMLQDILKEGILEYQPGETAKTINDEQLSEKRQRQLEERYETGWQEIDEED